MIEEQKQCFFRTKIIRSGVFQTDYDRGLILTIFQYLHIAPI